jgi:hypothetical protein
VIRPIVEDATVVALPYHLAALMHVNVDVTPLGDSGCGAPPSIAGQRHLYRDGLPPRIGTSTPPRVNAHRALLTAALGFLQVNDQPPEVMLLRRWLDSWAGLGDVIIGLTRQGLDLELRQFPHGWRANLYPTGTAHSIVIASAWEPTPCGRCSRRAGPRSTLRADGPGPLPAVSDARTETAPAFGEDFSFHPTPLPRSAGCLG